MTRIASAFVLGLSLFIFAQAQVPPTDDDQDVVKISTTLIQLDAVVMDRNGKQVTTLTADDFEVFENGKKQVITNFSYVSLSPERTTTTVSGNPAAAPANIPIPTSALRSEQIRRTYALVVDDLGLPFDTIPYVKDALRKFVNEEVQQGDLVAIVRTGGGIGALQSFTSDKRQLLMAIDKIRWNPNGRSGISAFDPIRTTLKQDLGTITDSGGNVTSVAGTEEELELLGDITEDRRESFEAGSLSALNFIVRGMSKLPGRKSVVLFSDGFQAVSTRQDRSRSTHIFDSLRNLADLASRSSVVFYTMDPRGLQVASMATADDDIREVVPTESTVSKAPMLDAREVELRESHASLRYLAYQTGGFPILNKNNLFKGIERIIQDQQGYYLIAYEPDDETFDPTKRKYNQVKIEVKGEGLEIRTRNGFFAIPDERLDNLPTSAGQQIYQALTSPFNSGDINLTLHSVFANDSTKGNFLQSLVFIRGRDLKFVIQPDGNYKADFDIVAMTFGETSTPIDQATRNYTLTVDGENYSRVREKGLVYRLNVPIKKPGAYQFRVALRDSQSGKVGSASQFVEIPNLKKKRLAISGIAVNNYSSEDWNLIRSGKAPTARANAEFDNASRIFKKGSVLQYGYMIYNAKAKGSASPDLEIRSRLIFNGRVILEGPPSDFDASGQQNPSRLESAGAITLGSKLMPGNYILQVFVTDKNANRKRSTATQWVEFEIVG